ncbi:MAG TPA: Ig-like domain-containing protein [Gemmatimonadota bacterium]
MRLRALAERAAGLAALALVAAACGGGGGGGNPIGPDVTPPGRPESSRIVVEAPIPTPLARLTGSTGAVENNSTVRLSNTSAALRTGQPVTSSAQASADGSFTVSVPAQLGDQLEVTAADAAGNVSVPLALQAGPVPTTLTVADLGDDQFLTLTTGEGAFSLPFPGGNERYTVVVQSLNPGVGPFPLTVTGSSSADVRALGPSAREGTPAGIEAGIRAFERRVMPTLPRGSLGRRIALSDDPTLGSVRTFNVVNRFDTVPDLTNRDHFDEVTARLRYKGEHTLIYVETRTEGPSISDALIDELGDRFDDQTYDIDRQAFGSETDIDDNGRVIVLMTATVNGANTQATVDQGGIFTGFFYAIDLLFHEVFNPFSNDGEIFYTVVPDPHEQYSPAAIPVEGFAELLHGVLAHEFQHMINAGGRLDPGVAFETVWLDEGLAHYAETLNGVTFDGVVDLQNSLRSALWLQRPYQQSIVSGDDTLERRGAAWLLVAYLVDHYGQGILRDLVGGPSTGIPNIENAADTSLPFLFYRFTAALYLDGQAISSDPWFDIPGLDVRQRFQAAKQFWAGTTRLPGSYLGVKTSTVPGSLSSVGVSLAGTTPAYFDVSAASTGTIPVIVRANRSSNLQVTIIRTR